MFEISDYIKRFRKFFSAKDVLLVPGIITLYFITRLINLDSFPIFSDEGIYVHWAKVAWHDAAWRFVSLTDGKQPFQTWGTIPFLKMFPDNSLLAGRLFSVTTGFGALAGVFTMLSYLFSKRTAYIGALLYIFTPIFLFYDRMALVDSGVNAFFIWILVFSILLARMRRLDVAIIFGLIGGFALLAKSSVRIFIGLSALAPIFFFERNIKRFSGKAINFYILYVIACVLSLLIYNVQRLSPFFHYVAEKNKTFVVTFDEFLANPFAHFFNNMKLVPLYVAWEMGFVLFFIGLIGLALLYKKDKKLGAYFFLWLILPYIIIMFVSKVLFPRYVIFFGSLLLITASYFFSNIKSKTIVMATTILYVLSVGYFNYTIVSDFKNIPFPPIDRGQYIEGWTAGWGMKEIVEYMRKKSKDKPVIVLAEGNFGLSGDVLDTHLKRDDRIFIKGYWPLEEKELLENQKELDKNYVFVVFAHKNEYPEHWPLKLIKKHEKPGNQSVTYLFELTK